MTNSETLRKLSSEEDNDIKAFGLQTKALREERIESFEREWLKKLIKSKEILQIIGKGTHYEFTLNNEEKLDFYPKANKLLIRRINKWVKPGLKYLINKYIN